MANQVICFCSTIYVELSGHLYTLCFAIHFYHVLLGGNQTVVESTKCVHQIN